MSMDPQSYNHRANRLRMDLNEAAPLLIWYVQMFDEYRARRQGLDVISDLFYVQCSLQANGELFTTEMKIDPFILGQAKIDMLDRIVARVSVEFGRAIAQWRK